MIIHTEHRANGKDYSRDIDVTAFAESYLATTWLGAVIRGMSAQSKLQKLDTSDVARFLKLIGGVQKDSAISDYLALPQHIVTRNKVSALFGVAETILQATHLAPSTLARASMKFRKWMLELPPSAHFGEDVSRIKVVFKTRLTGRCHHRETLSNDVDSTYDGALANPIDAMPHSTARELRSLIETRMDLDLRRVTDACTEELKYWADIRRKLDNLSKKEITEKELACAIEFLTKPITKSVERQAQGIDQENFLAACAKISTQKNFAGTLHPKGASGRFLENVVESVLGVSSDRLKGLRVGHLVLIRQRINSLELIANFILLLAATGWNSDALRQLEVSGISKVEGGYVIQAFKGKSDDETPVIYIGAEDRAAIRAIEQLLYFNNLLQQLGVIALGEGRLWFSWGARPCCPLIEQYSAFNFPLKTLMEKYKLKYFSLDQVRTHVLNRLAVKTNNVDELRRLAGHKMLRTSFGYIEQPIIQILSKATNLELQRRLENTIKWQMEQQGEQFSSPAIERFVDKNLFVAIGDGSTCSNIRQPPDEAWLYQGKCDMKRCHQGDGCSRNQVKLTGASVEEVFRLKNYYTRNWQRLRERNIDAFERFHAPAIIFNFALTSIIRNSIYWPDIQFLLAQRGIDETPQQFE